MSYEYVCPKKQFQKEEIEKAQVFFRNGDFFELAKGEIVDIDIQFYDKLIAGEKGFCPVVKSGFIKCKLGKNKPRYDSSLLYNKKEYSKNRKQYLEERCVNEGGVYYIRLFDENYWHYAIYGDVVAYKDGEGLVFSFEQNKTYGSSDKSYHTVMAPNVTKQVIEKIDLDFENCDDIEIFQEEIEDMQINFEEQLEWNSSCYGREIRNGFIRLRFDKEIAWRKADILGVKKNTVKNFTKRICGKGIEEIDITHLYLTYKYAGYFDREECIGVPDIRPVEEQKQDDEHGICYHVSGYAKKEHDGSILIVFGKAKEDL